MGDRTMTSEIVSSATLVLSIMFIIHFLFKLKQDLDGPVDFNGDNDQELHKEARQRVNSLLIKHSPFLLIGIGFMLASYLIAT